MSIDILIARIESPLLRQVAGHWAESCRGRAMPAWRDVDPVQLGRALPYLWIWQYDRGTGELRNRLAGEQIIAWNGGRNPRRKQVEEYYAPRVATILRERFERVLHGPSFWHSSGLVYWDRFRLGKGERICLPLANDGLTADGLIGATVYINQDAGEPPPPDGEAVEFLPVTLPAPTA